MASMPSRRTPIFSHAFHPFHHFAAAFSTHLGNRQADGMSIDTGIDSKVRLLQSPLDVPDSSRVEGLNINQPRIRGRDHRQLLEFHARSICLNVDVDPLDETGTRLSSAHRREFMQRVFARLLHGLLEFQKKHFFVHDRLVLNQFRQEKRFWATGPVS
jgi:hypothetical protein